MFNFDKKYFERNQERLIYIANHKWSRWILGLNRLPEQLKHKKIEKITPNSIAFNNEDGSQTGAFFTRPRFAEALAYNLSPLAYLMNSEQTSRKWRFSPVGAVAMILIAVSGSGFLIASTTETYYASGDGSVSRDSATWSDAQSNANGNDYSTSNDRDYCGHRYTSGKYTIFRCFFPINTSGIPDTATISAASFYWKSYAPINVLHTGNATILQWTNGTVIENNDYSAFNSTKLATDVNISANDTWYNWDLNETGIGTVSKTGSTNFCLRETDHDYNNSSSTADHRTDMYMDDTTGTSSDPYLSVTYTTEAAFIPKITII